MVSELPIFQTNLASPRHSDGETPLKPVSLTLRETRAALRAASEIYREIHDTIADYSSIHEATGWKPTSRFEAGVKRLCEPPERRSPQRRSDSSRAVPDSLTSERQEGDSGHER